MAIMEVCLIVNECFVIIKTVCVVVHRNESSTRQWGDGAFLGKVLSHIKNG